MKLRDYTWRDPRNAVGFAAECARRVLPIFERIRPNDDRQRNAIEIADACARGEPIAANAGLVVLDAASASAYGAADDAAASAYATAAVDVARDDAADAHAAARSAARAAHAAADAIDADADAVDVVDIVAGGVDDATTADPTLDVDVIQARWILRDLYGGDVPIDRLEPALGALSVSVEMAQEILHA